ncbi:MAG: ketoacyl-ACP synthase III [Thermoleophilia bacterium]
MAILGGRPVTITGLGTFVPEHEVANDDLPSHLDTSDAWIAQRTGIRARRVAEPGTSASELAVPAAHEALVQSGVGAEDIGLVMVATITPDQLTPATAARVAHAVGARNAGALDLSAGCSGFVYGLAAASSMVSSGLYEHVLLVGSEVLSSILDWEDRGTAVLFGDGAGAAIVSAANGAGRILGFDLGNDGSGADLLGVPAGGSRLPASAETVASRSHYLKMNGREIYRFATRLVPASVERVLAASGRTAADVDLFMPHQANLRIIESVAEKLGIPMSRVHTTLQRYGNTSGASIPLGLAEALREGRLRPGDLVLMVGFGAGLSWGSCLMEWGGIGEG